MALASVSIHAFREGRRQEELFSIATSVLFQSTPSAREGDWIARGKATQGVSIHAFREGRRQFGHYQRRTDRSFNPRLPRGKATSLMREVRRVEEVSIHAFREGRRPGECFSLLRMLAFQSTPSAREGDVPVSIFAPTVSRGFNPRLPRGKATAGLWLFPALRSVSIHAFREGRRPPFTLIIVVSASFNPRLPRGKATRRVSFRSLRSLVSIHAFREGRRLDTNRDRQPF